MALDKLNSRKTCTEGISRHFILKHILMLRYVDSFFRNYSEIKVLLIKACVSLWNHNEDV